ncbi:MAG: class I SAM-dependent methyltransferase [Deltaproteobacteria bacterium]|nr:class I SAM-dependent methyltransferase [Deltaproteobacteria bacterium]
MDFDLLKQVNSLWRRIYPFLASQIAASYQKDFGSVLELGPFSGGISLELAEQYPELRITIADTSLQVLEYFAAEIEAAGLSRGIEVRQTDLNFLDFNDSQFDLVIFRGAFFFLDERGKIFWEIFRVLKEDGIAFVGGGYGKDTPDEFIREIADESRELNDRLGRKRVTVENLKEILRRSEMGGRCRIVEEGGLWVIIEK